MEKLYKHDDSLQKLIDWGAIMKMTPDAGGHDEQMQGLIAGAEVIGHAQCGDYQGQVATCVRLPDGRYAIYNDYYGSCSGCDDWVGASKEDVRKMCIDLANSAYVFLTLDDVKAFLSAVPSDDNWTWRDIAACLLAEIKRNHSA